MHQIDRDCSTQPLRDSTKSVEMFPEREFSDQNLVPIHLFTKSVEMCLKERVYRPKPCWSYSGWRIRTLCILVGYKTLLYLSIGFLIW